MLTRRRKRGRVVEDDQHDDEEENENVTPPIPEEPAEIVDLVSDDDEPPLKRRATPISDEMQEDEKVEGMEKKRRTTRKKVWSFSVLADSTIEEETKSKRRSKRSASLSQAANYSSLTDPPKRRKTRSNTRKRAISLNDNELNETTANTVRAGSDDDVEVLEISNDSDFVEVKPRKRQPRTQALFRDSNTLHDKDVSLGERVRSLDSSTVVMSSRKRSEIRLWLEAAIDGSGPRLLVLHGPPGCGKWSALRAIFGEFKLVPLQWEPPIPRTRTSVLGAMMDSLESFLVGVNYTPLSGAAETKRVVVLRDLPVSLTDSPIRRERLQDVLGRYARNVRVPSVLLLSDDAKGVARLLRLIGSKVTDSARVVKIPAPSAIATRKALTRVARSEGLDASAKTLDKLADAANGDLRGALNALHLGGGCDIGKDGVLSTYHAVSKVLNNKRLANGDSKYDVEAVLSESKADPRAFVAFLHENYTDFVDNLDDAALALDALSDADTIMHWDPDAQLRNMLAECAASVTTRAFLHFNRAPIRGGWRPIRGPTSYTIATAAIEYAENARITLLPHGEVVTRASLLQNAAYAEKIRGVRSTRWYNGSGVADADLAMVDTEVRVNDAQSATMSSQRTEFSGRSQEYEISQEVIVPAAAASGSESIESWSSENEAL